ncbi:hypothetical protein, partial [Heyndrickxia coagulans]|uniref:hypothetical protein n=1 Tax=Heyndrickxia coagulans TaxID=1398 RepID=UPI002E1A1D4F|nr:hypothetical protein [Heyndrickxia coagulans]
LKNKFANKKEFHFVENISLRYTAFHILPPAVILSKTGCIPVKAVNSVFYTGTKKPQTICLRFSFGPATSYSRRGKPPTTI